MNNLFTNNVIGVQALQIELASIDYNGYFGNGAMCSPCSPGPNLVAEDPVYRDVARGDFSLTPGSRVIDRGVEVGWDLNGPDLAGDWNGAAPDLGAFESP